MKQMRKPNRSCVGRDKLRHFVEARRVWAFHCVQCLMVANIKVTPAQASKQPGAKARCQDAFGNSPNLLSGNRRSRTAIRSLERVEIASSRRRSLCSFQTRSTSIGNAILLLLRQVKDYIETSTQNAAPGGSLISSRDSEAVSDSSPVGGKPRYARSAPICRTGVMECGAALGPVAADLQTNFAPCEFFAF